MNRCEPMFCLNSPHKADMATDMAIPLLAEGGWSAMTLRSLGRAAKVSGPAVAAWYGSVERLHEVIAARYGHRWLRLMSWNLIGNRRSSLGAADILAALLPQDDDGIAYTRVWLAIQEAGRTEPSVGAAVAGIEAQERDLVAGWLGQHALDQHASDHHALDQHLDVTMVVLRGLRAAICAPGQPLSCEEARALAHRLGRALDDLQAGAG
jgi:AcrR family transcriptional regulator